MMFTSLDVERIVRSSGWSEERKFNRKIIENSIQLEGYPVFENVIDFLESFWELIILFDNKRNGIRNDDISFRFDVATHLEVPEKICNNYSRRIGKELCLIGSAFRENMVLVMADDNTVYGGYDDYLCKIGLNGFDAIEAIVLDKPFIEIE